MIRVTGDHAVAVLALAMIVSVGVTATPVTRRYTEGENSPPPAAAPLAPPPVDLTPLRRFAPFGAKVAAGGDTGVAGTAGLELRGIMLARPASASIALIAAAGGPAKGYAIGATLPGGAILDSVEFDLVVLRASGQLVTLALPTGPGAASSERAVPAAAPAAAAADPIEAHHAQVESRDALSLLGSLGATGGPGGYRVGAGLPDDLRHAGLQPGDTIEKVDGVAIGSAERDRDLFDKAVVAGRMRVDLVRDGRPVSVTVPLH